MITDQELKAVEKSLAKESEFGAFFAKLVFHKNDRPICVVIQHTWPGSSGLTKSGKLNYWFKKTYGWAIKEADSISLQRYGERQYG